MGISTPHLCVAAVVSNEQLHTLFLQGMTKSDARQVSEQQKCITECMWTYPLAWQSQLKGSKDRSIIVLKSVSDLNFGLAHIIWGSLNAKQHYCLGSKRVPEGFSEWYILLNLDFEFEVDGKTFYEVWFKVDRIYPEFSKCVKSIFKPIWQ